MAPAITIYGNLFIIMNLSWNYIQEATKCEQKSVEENMWFGLMK